MVMVEHVNGNDGVLMCAKFHCHAPYYHSSYKLE